MSGWRRSRGATAVGSCLAIMLLASASASQDQPDRRRFRVLSTDAAEVHQLSEMTLSPDGNTIAVGTWYGGVQLWDWRKATMIGSLHLRDAVVSNLLFTDSGSRLAVLLHNEDIGFSDAFCVEMATGVSTSIGTIDGDGLFLLTNGDIALSNGDAFSIVDNKGSYEGQQIPFEVHISSPTPSPDGRLIVGNGWDEHYNNLVFLDGGGRFLREIELGYLLHDPVFSPDGGLLGVREEENGDPDNVADFDPATNGYDLFDVKTGRKLYRLSGHELYLSGGAFSPDGTQFLSWSGDKTLILSDVSTGKQIRRLKGHRDSVSDAIFLDNGKLIASASTDGSIKIWSARTGREIVSMHAVGYDNGKPSYIAIKPDGHFAEGGDVKLSVSSLDEGGRDGPELSDTERAALKLGSIDVTDDAQ